MVKKKIVAIVQARSNSIRLPGKILKSVNGVAAIELLLKRLKKAKFLDQIVIATSNQKKNLKFRNFLEKKKIEYYAGSENNVLLRYFETATKYKADIIVRITGDSIIIDPSLIDNFIKIFKKKKN